MVSERKRKAQATERREYGWWERWKADVASDPQGTFLKLIGSTRETLDDIVQGCVERYGFHPATVDAVDLSGRHPEEQAWARHRARLFAMLEAIIVEAQSTYWQEGAVRAVEVFAKAIGPEAKDISLKELRQGVPVLKRAAAEDHMHGYVLNTIGAIPDLKSACMEAVWQDGTTLDTAVELATYEAVAAIKPGDGPSQFCTYAQEGVRGINGPPTSKRQSSQTPEIAESIHPNRVNEPEQLLLQKEELSRILATIAQLKDNAGVFAQAVQEMQDDPDLFGVTVTDKLIAQHIRDMRDPRTGELVWPTCKVGDLPNLRKRNRKKLDRDTG